MSTTEFFWPPKSGIITSASNLGIGTGIFSSLVGTDLQFKSIIAGTNISITNDATTITINSTGGSGSALAHPTSGSTFETGQYNLSMTGTGNTAIGVGSAKLLTSGESNVAIGNNALKSSITSSFNVAIGRGAAFSQISGSNNLFLGDSCGWQVTTGSGNTLLGAISGGSLTTGLSNTFVGALAGYWRNSSNEVIIDGIGRNDTADDLESSLIYGLMDPLSINQTLRLNANVKIKHQLQFLGSTSGSVNFVAPAVVTSPSVYTLPATDGTNGQVLKTNGAGVLSFTTVSGGLSNQVLTVMTIITAASISPISLIALPIGSFVDKIKIVIDTPFDGSGATLEVGITGNTDKYMTADENDLYGISGDVYTSEHGNANTTTIENVFVTLVKGSALNGSVRAMIFYSIPTIV